MERFNDIEKKYLEGPYGEEGVGRIVSQSVILGKDGKGVVWSDTLGKNDSQCWYSAFCVISSSLLQLTLSLENILRFPPLLHSWSLSTTPPHPYLIF